jgi:putative methylase
LGSRFALVPKAVRQRDLAILLAKVPPPPAPRPELEQYQTPSDIAAEALFLAYAAGDIAGRKVVDLGCGTGILALGCAALGAEVTGIDVDERMIQLANDNALRLDLEVAFRVADVTTVAETFDAVVMNPPFGAQFASRAQGGDKTFLEAAWRVAPITYSFHLTETTPHLARFARSNGVDVQPVAAFSFPLPATMAFHRKPRAHVDVAFLRFERSP